MKPENTVRVLRRKLLKRPLVHDKLEVIIQHELLRLALACLEVNKPPVEHLIYIAVHFTDWIDGVREGESKLYLCVNRCTTSKVILLYHCQAVHDDLLINHHASIIHNLRCPCVPVYVPGISGCILTTPRAVCRVNGLVYCCTHCRVHVTSLALSLNVLVHEFTRARRERLDLGRAD